MTAPLAAYTVNPGDTASSIATRHGITWPELASLNPGLPASGDWGQIVPGEIFQLPVSEAILVLMGSVAPEPPPAAVQPGVVPVDGGVAVAIPPEDTERDRALAELGSSCEFFDAPPEGCPPGTLSEVRSVETGIPSLPVMMIICCSPELPDEGEGVLDTLSTIAEGVLDAVDKIISTPAAVIASTADDILGVVTAQLSGTIPTLAELALGLGETVIEGLDFIQENMADLGDVGGMLTNAIGKALELAGEGLGKAVEIAITSGMGGTFELLEGEAGPELRALVEEMADNDAASEAQADVFRRVAQPEAPFDLFGMIAAFTAGLFRVGGSRAEAMVETARQRSLELATPMQAPMEPAAAAMIRGYFPKADYDRGIQREGFKPGWGAALVSLALSKVNVGEIVEARRRGTWTEARALAELHEQGFNPERAEMILQLGEVLPPINDELRFLVREVFQPEIRARFGMDQEFPEGSLPRLGRLGISEDNIRNYWAAHWELPSIQLGFEMLHRTAETGVTEADLDTLLRALDVMPFWQEKLKAISFATFTRVDIRRMHKIGVLADEQVAAEYQRIGYNVPDAEALAAFTFQLNQADDETALEAFRAPLRSRVVSNFINGNLSATVTREALANLDYGPDAVEAFLAEAQFARDADLAQEATGLIGKLYEQGFRNRSSTVSALRSFGADEDDLDRFFQIWDLRREFRTERESEKSERDLTRSDLVGAYRDAIIPREMAEEMLRSLGYDLMETETILARVDVKKVERLARQREKFVRGRYIKGSLTRQAASQALDSLEMSVERREGLLDDWQIERDERQPELTQAQVGSALKKGIRDEPWARGRLAALGYDETDTSVLIELATQKDES